MVVEYAEAVEALLLSMVPVEPEIVSILFICIYILIELVGYKCVCIKY